MEARESRNEKMEGVDTINLFFILCAVMFLKNLRLVKWVFIYLINLNINFNILF